MVWSFWRKKEIGKAADWMGAISLFWPELQKVGTGPDNQTLGLKRKEAGGRREGRGPRGETEGAPGLRFEVLDGDRKRVLDSLSLVGGGAVGRVRGLMGQTQERRPAWGEHHFKAP